MGINDDKALEKCLNEPEMSISRRLDPSPKHDSGHYVELPLVRNGKTLEVADGEVFDKVLGLELGADDYMIKPFDSNELVARVKAVLRRTVMTQAVTTAAPVSIAEVTDHQGEFVEYDGLLINMTNYTVTLDGESVEMPPKELELLYFLAKRPNQVFTRDQLLDRLWDYEYAGDSRTVDVHIKRLREKLNENHNWSISTVWGKGYKFEVK